MTVPAKRISKRRTRSRRSHQALKKVHLTTCSKCGQITKPHHACLHCGYYRGRDILKKQQKIEKKLPREAKKSKEAANATTPPAKPADLKK